MLSSKNDSMNTKLAWTSVSSLHDDRGQINMVGQKGQQNAKASSVQQQNLQPTSKPTEPLKGNCKKKRFYRAHQ